MEHEEWRWIPGFEHMYEISNLGRVRSHRSKEQNRILKHYTDPRGYKQIVFTVNGRPRTHWLHRLVAEAFIPNPHKKPTVNHISGNKEDNSVTNLEWATRSENTTHGYRTGLLKPPMLRGEQGFHKLTEKQVMAIRREYLPRKVSYSVLSQKYGVSTNTIKRIMLRKSWTHF